MTLLNSHELTIGYQNGFKGLSSLRFAAFLYRTYANKAAFGSLYS